MHAPIPPPQSADIPERKLSFWRMTGPGAVLVGLSIGAGEIIIWPLIAAEYGPSMLWAAALGVFLQLWVNIEIGRWAVATGESCYTGFARLSRAWVYIFIMFNVAGWLLPGWARASGQALRALIFQHPTNGGPDWLWTGITFAFVALVLFGPRKIYASVEKMVMVLVALITVGLVYIAFKVGTWELMRDMIGGVLNFGYIEKGVDGEGGIEISTLFAALVFAGAGGTANLFYAYYLRDKQIGMGARVPILMNPFRQREQSASDIGYVYPESDENRRRFRDWFKFVKIDQALYFWLLNTFTMFLFIFGSLAVLHPAGIVPGKESLLWDEAQILMGSMGSIGRPLFLVIGLATLFSTQATLTDGVARTMADLFTTNFSFARRAGAPRWYVGFVIGIIVVGTALTFLLDIFDVSAVTFLFNAAYIGGFAMAVYVPLLLWMNLRHLPKSARPHPVNIAMMLAASAVYIGFAIVCLYGYYEEFFLIERAASAGM